MDGNFSIDVDPARDLVRIEVGGFFTSSDLVRFADAWRAALVRLRCPRNQQLTLVDTRAALICSQEMVDRWSALAADPTFSSRRLAFIVAPTLVRKQLQRATAEIAAREFTDESEAEIWLFSQEVDIAA